MFPRVVARADIDDQLAGPDVIREVAQQCFGDGGLGVPKIAFEGHAVDYHIEKSVVQA
jgi:hypothetical protein